MKKHFMAKIAICLCIVMVGVTGCGKKQKKEAAFQPKLDTKKQVVLSTTGFFGNFEALDQVIADFNQYYPNVEFSYEQNGIDNFEDYMKANANVDVIMTSEEIFEKYPAFTKELCADLEKEDIAFDAIDKKMLSRGYHNGRLSCIPIGQNIYGLVVNETLLKKKD